jgi:dihydrodipicolinate synthase/N-acetylneuraminate lyase
VKSRSDVTAPDQPEGAARWQGVFAILCTPFYEGGELDLPSLQRETEFCLEAGTHGLVASVNASEYWTLSDDERRRVAEVTVKSVNGAVPVVVGVTAGSADWAASLARHAEEIGADAIMAMPPPGRPISEPDIFRYFEQLTSATGLPVFVQNHDAPQGTRMSASLVARIVRELPNADWIKEETIPPGGAISVELAEAGPKLRGVMGGIAGRYLFDEHARGTCGTMPACESVDVHAQVWNLLAAGDVGAARQLFGKLLPLLNFEAIFPGVYKTVLYWRGVIGSDYLRSHFGNPLDKQDRRELSTILRALEDAFRVAPLQESRIDSERSSR